MPFNGVLVIFRCPVRFCAFHLYNAEYKPHNDGEKIRQHCYIIKRQNSLRKGYCGKNSTNKNAYSLSAVLLSRPFLRGTRGALFSFAHLFKYFVCLFEMLIVLYIHFRLLHETIEYYYIQGGNNKFRCHPNHPARDRIGNIHSKPGGTTDHGQENKRNHRNNAYDDIVSIQSDFIHLTACRSPCLFPLSCYMIYTAGLK